MNKHLVQLLERCPELQVCREEIEQVFVAMCASLRGGGKLLLAGNGGSAADAEHWTGELLKGFCSKRPLSARERDSLPGDIGTKLQGGIPAIPLTGFTALTTAFNNDVDPQLTFAQLIWALGRPGDVFIGISTSGRSPNVLRAMRAARELGLVTIGFCGAKKAEILDLSDIALRAPSESTPLIQQIHITAAHIICGEVEADLFREKVNLASA